MRAEIDAAQPQTTQPDAPSPEAIPGQPSAPGKPAPAGRGQEARPATAADVIELILADHRRIAKLLGALEDAIRHRRDPGGNLTLAEVWRRLASLLELHAEAEQEICYLAMFAPGPDAAAQIAQMRDALADHDDIREAITEAGLHAVGSPAWWRPAAAAVGISSTHIASAERGVLAAFARRTDPALREELGRQWTAFTVARTRDAANAAGAADIGDRVNGPPMGRCGKPRSASA